MTQCVRSEVVRTTKQFQFVDYILKGYRQGCLKVFVAEFCYD